MDVQPVLLLGGSDRSAITLIETLLNELPTTVAIGGSTHVWDRGLLYGERCDCGHPFEDCVRWKAIGDLAFGGWNRIDAVAALNLVRRVDRARSLPAVLHALRRRRPTGRQRDYLTLVAPVLRAVGDLTGVSPDSPTPAGRPVTAIDSSLRPTTAGLLSLEPSLDVRLVQLVRDPRTHVTPGGIRRWIATNLGFEALAGLVPVLLLRYEDIVAEPAHHLHRLASFAGLDPGDIDLRFLHGATAQLRRPLHSLAGDPTSFGGTELAVDTDSLWSWNRTAAHRLAVTIAAGPLLRRYGYEADPLLIWAGGAPPAASPGVTQRCSPAGRAGSTGQGPKTT